MLCGNVGRGHVTVATGLKLGSLFFKHLLGDFNLKKKKRDTGNLKSYTSTSSEWNFYRSRWNGSVEDGMMSH